MFPSKMFGQGVNVHFVRLGVNPTFCTFRGVRFVHLGGEAIRLSKALLYCDHLSSDQRKSRL